MEKEYCVYMHTFPNGKRYVGITCCYPPNRRWQNGHGYSRQDYLYNAIQKYGWDNITHDVLKKDLTAEEAGTLEQEYIQKYKTYDKEYGYNLTDGGEVGYHLSQEHKDKIGKANSGQNNGMYGHEYSEAERSILSKVWRGRKHSEESRKKMSEYAKAHPEIKSHKGADHPMYGKKHSLESKKKMSESAKKRGYCGNNTRIVSMYSHNDEFIRMFQSMAEAQRITGVMEQNIRKVCLGHRKYAGGYIWRYGGGDKSQVC